MSHRDQDGEKVENFHFFFKSTKLVRTYEIKNCLNLKSFYLILAGKVVPSKISALRLKLGCAPYAQKWVFFVKFMKFNISVALLLSL